MGQKVHPTGMRLGIVEQSKSKWYSKDYAKTLHEDLSVRKLLEEKLSQASVSRIDIERPARSAKVTIHSARPGVIIGKSGKELEGLRREVGKLLHLPADASVHINVEEIRKPDIDAKLIAENIAQQLVKRIAFRRAMKRAMSTAMRSGAKGIKVSVSGRLGGAEIARSEWAREGRIPLHTLRADIDYGTAEAKTTYGIIGVKVWVFKGEVIGDNEADTSTSGKAAKKK